MGLVLIDILAYKSLNLIIGGLYRYGENIGILFEINCFLYYTLKVIVKIFIMLIILFFSDKYLSIHASFNINMRIVKLKTILMCLPFFEYIFT